MCKHVYALTNPSEAIITMVLSELLTSGSLKMTDSSS